jgi:hypothetical protein
MFCITFCKCFFLVVEEDSESLVHHLPVGCVEWCVLVSDCGLGFVLVVDVAQAMQDSLKEGLR